jgi:tRNA threonylcarbamoyl adenosine modification protein (Sua5/YciO/YrdC/YwlC family)
MLHDYVKPFGNPVFKLMKSCLPGPFTFILEANPVLTRLMGSRRSTIGIRIPANDIIRAIASELAHPIVSSSLHDEDEIIKFPTEPKVIFDQYKHQVDMAIDGGTGKNEESTIVDCTGAEPLIVRQGIGVV